MSLTPRFSRNKNTNRLLKSLNSNTNINHSIFTHHTITTNNHLRRATILMTRQRQGPISLKFNNRQRNHTKNRIRGTTSTHRRIHRVLHNRHIFRQRRQTNITRLTRPLNQSHTSANHQTFQNNRIKRHLFGHTRAALRHIVLHITRHQYITNIVVSVHYHRRPRRIDSFNNDHNQILQRQNNKVERQRSV